MTKRTISVFLFLTLLLLYACSERPTQYYAKYEDAVKAEAVKRGWIPEIVPAMATDIHEQHDLDTNDRWIRFAVPAPDKDKLKAALKKLSDAEIVEIRVRYPSKVNWWFESLIQQAPANDNGLNAEIYVVECGKDKCGYVAFDRVSPRVYYWCTG